MDENTTTILCVQANTEQILSNNNSYLLLVRGLPSSGKISIAVDKLHARLHPGTSVWDGDWKRDWESELVSFGFLLRGSAISFFENDLVSIRSGNLTAADTA